MLVLESVLHRVARRELVLVLQADDDVPLGISTVDDGHLLHLFGVVILCQTRVGTRIGYVCVERATGLEPIGMGESSGATALMRPRAAGVPHDLPFGRVGYVVPVVVNQSGEP